MPTVYPDLVWAWQAFEFCHRTRSNSGSGPLPIQATEIEAYCRLRGIKADDDIDFLLRVIPVLDNWWLKDFYEKQKIEQRKLEAKAKNKPATTTPRGGRRRA